MSRSSGRWRGPHGPVLDADSHAVEDHDAVLALLDPVLRPLAPRFAARPDGTVRLVSVEGRAWEPRFRFTLTGPLRERQRRLGAPGLGSGERVRVLDDEGIDLAVVIPSLGLYVALYDDAEVAAALCRAENRWLGGWCGEAADRLAPLAVLPQQEPALAARELAEAVERDGAVGGVVRPNPSGGRRVDVDDFDELWSTAVALDVPVVLHEGWLGGGCPTLGAERATSYAAAHAMSHPFEAMSAMLGLAGHGVLDRFPSLRVGLFEAGATWAPWWAARIGDHADLRPGSLAGAAALAERIWLTCEPGEVGLEWLMTTPWAERVCFSTDYPHLDATFPGAVRVVCDQDLGAPAERALLGANALALFGRRVEARLGGAGGCDRGARTGAGSGAGAGPDPVVALLRRFGAHEVAHSGRTLLDHLLGTGALLEAWGARPAVCDAGRLHSVYGTAALRTAVAGERDRAVVRAAAGAEAEALAWWFGRCEPASILDRATGAGPLVDATGRPLDLDGDVVADLALVAAANLVDQHARVPDEARPAVVAAAVALAPVLPPPARRAVRLAAAVVGDELAFRAWARSSQRIVTLDLGGGGAAPPTFEPAALLGSAPALAAVTALADDVRAGGTAGDRVAARLARRVPVDAEEAASHLGGSAFDALRRVGALEVADAGSGRVTLAFGLMALGDEVVVVPHDGRRADGVYFGVEPLLLDAAARALAPSAAAALELGAGAGLASVLLARRTARVVATDVLGRATACVALSRAANPHLAHRLDVVAADGARGLRPGGFDLVVANPPHVPAGRAAPVYADGGPSGGELPARLLHDAVRLLVPGGAAVVLAVDWTCRDGSRPLTGALARLGPGVRWRALATPWPTLAPGGIERIVAAHADVLVAGRHVGVLAVRVGSGVDGAAADTRLADATAALTGVGWSVEAPSGG